MTAGASILDRLLAGLPEGGTVADVRVGALWTAVVVETARGLRAGLASTQTAHDLQHGQPAVRDAGRLPGLPAARLARWAQDDRATDTERAIGFAALNALLEVDPRLCVERNAEEIIVERGAGRRVAVVGHFPFVPRVRAAAATCWVLELSPGEGDMDAGRAPEVVPQADVVAITGMTLVNRTFDGLIGMCRPDAYVLVLGATTPLSPVLFDYGVTNVSGALVDDIPAMLAAVGEGANFRQIPGKRLVMMERPEPRGAGRP